LGVNGFGLFQVFQAARGDERGHHAWSLLPAVA
jgi:hypothetical protein